MTLSDGTIVEPVNSFKKNQVKLAQLQRPAIPHGEIQRELEETESENFPLTLAYRQHPPRLPSQSHNNSQQKSCDECY